MSKVIIGGGGAGGIDFDDLDTLPGDVLAGKKFGGIGSDDPQVGTMPYIGTSKKAISGGVNTQGIYYYIPKGYYFEGANNPWVYLTQPEVATIVGATPNKILAGQDICGVAGNVNVQSILAFNCAVYSSTAITFNWQNPAKGAFSGVIIVGKNGSYPTSIGDGTRYYQGFGNNASANGWSSVVANNFVGGNTYYFRCFSYAIKGGAEWIHSNSLTANATTSKGQVVLTSSGVWTVPANVRNIDIFLVGGGGGGRNSQSYYSGQGGGSGYTGTWKNIGVTPSQTIAYEIGSGSNGGGPNNANQGGTTSFAGMSVQGGFRSPYAGNPGGKGGSAGAQSVDGAGNQDGNNGYSDGNGNQLDPNQAGQGSTTKSFGESNGILYAGGGGSGAKSKFAGIGGAGGGGDGAGNAYGYPRTLPTAGTPNTGGGGGGNTFYVSNQADVNGRQGGSGVIIVRWGY